MLKNNIEKEVKRKEKIVSDYLNNEIKPLLKENMCFRGIGLIWGIEFNDGKLSRKTLDKCFEKGLIIRCLVKHCRIRLCRVPDEVSGFA